MEYIGIDVHQRESQVCIVDEDGHVLLERRVRTRGERFAALLEGRGRARVVLEASTESEWVAQALETLGYEVIVADPNFAPMYATRSRRVKTDRRDARTLADSCRLGAYRATLRTSAAQRTVRAQLAVREALVRTRTRYISVLRAVLRRDGVRVPSGGAATFGQRVQTLPLSATRRGWSPRWWRCSSPPTGSWRPSRPSWRAGWRHTRQRGGCARCRAWVR
jgi:transposase